MPLPQVLADIIKKLGSNFAPDSERNEFKIERENWQLYLDLMELDQLKLQRLLDKHDQETDPRYQLRQKLAAVFNYTPTLIRMVVNYLHWEQPTIDVGGDAQLKAFVDNCDGTGTTLVQFIRQQSLPLALVYGFVDTLVQNPAVDEQFPIATQADQKQAGVSPQLFTIQPLQRIDWSTRSNHDYNWVRFIDYTDENNNPFRELAAGDSSMPVSYLTISGAVETITDLAGNAENVGGGGFWIRSWKGVTNDDGTPATPDETGRLPDGNAAWIHDGGWLPVSVAPVETLYYSRSNDPSKRHHGLSKIAMVAILTRKIIQILSWTDEDILANLAIFVFPGKPPTGEDGKPLEIKLTPFGIIWTGGNPQVQAQMLQGETTHIEIKMKLIDVIIREILRLAYLIGASADAEQITSGVQGVVARNELFMELSDIASALDSYTMGVLRLAKAHIENADVSEDTLPAAVRVNYFKGPYMVDPLETTIKNSESLIEVFSIISPEMVKQVYKQLALGFMYNEDKTRETVLHEIDTNFAAVQAEQQARRAAIEASLAVNVGSGGNVDSSGGAVGGAASVNGGGSGAVANPLQNA